MRGGGVDDGRLVSIMTSKTRIALECKVRKNAAAQSTAAASCRRRAYGYNQQQNYMLRERGKVQDIQLGIHDTALGAYTKRVMNEILFSKDFRNQFLIAAHLPYRSFGPVWRVMEISVDYATTIGVQCSSVSIRLSRSSIVMELCMEYAIWPLIEVPSVPQYNTPAPPHVAAYVLPVSPPTKMTVSIFQFVMS